MHRMPRTIFTYIVATLAAACTTACGTNKETIDKERSSIVTYLTNNKIPYQEVGGVYKQVNYASGSAVTAEAGDSVYIWYIGYVFGGNTSTYYNSNIREVFDQYSADASGYTFDAAGGVPGNGSFIRGINKGLVGSAEKDTITLYFTSDYGFGEKQLQAVPRNSPLKLTVIVDHIIKKQ